MANTKQARAEITNREWIEITITEDSTGTVDRIDWKSNGCSGLLNAAKAFSNAGKGMKASELSWQGLQHWDLLLKEALLKLSGTFQLPYAEDELCHCRKIPTAKVDQAIVLGAHTPEKVKAWTSASSGCGTCRPDVESLIRYRLGIK